jgi:hypothetical protein
VSDAVRRNTSVAIEAEVTEGTYVTPAAATSFVQTLSDGFEFKMAKELIDRSVFTSSIGQVSPRTGTRGISGTIPVEMRAHSTAGHVPEADLLFKSAFGSRRQNTTVVTTKSSGNTGSVLQIDDADISKFAVGDTVIVNQSGAPHLSPITAVDTSTGAANITLLVAKGSGTFSNSVTIGKFTTYVLAESGHPTLSISKYVESAIREYAVGCRVNKMSLSNFSTGKIPSMQFGFEGLDFDRSLTAPDYSPSYDSALPPIMLDGKIYMDGTAITINELSVSMEQTLGFKTSISSSNGKVSSRVTDRKLSGSFNPYVDTASNANYTKFINNTAFSLFAVAKNGTSTSYSNIVAIYMPNCIITERGETDQDGLLQESLSFSANRGSAGTTQEIFITFI